MIRLRPPFWPGLPLFFLAAALLAAEPFSSRQDTSPKARVVVVRDGDALETFNPRPDKIRAMIRRGLVQWTGKPTEAEAWRSLISLQDVVGVKVHAAPGPTSGTRPAVAGAVIEGLRAAGLPAKQIVIWDKHFADLKMSGFTALAARLGVRVAASLEAGYDEKIFYDNALPGQPVWGDLEFGRKGEGLGRHSYVTKLLTADITKIINLTPLLNHNLAGVSGSLYTLAMASVDNTLRFEADTARLAMSVPEIYALRAVGDRVVLHIVDALLCQYQGEQRALLHYSAVLNQLRFSTDPVALDVLSMEELDRQRKRARISFTNTNALELYRNASLLELGISDRNRIRVETAR